MELKSEARGTRGKEGSSGGTWTSGREIVRGAAEKEMHKSNSAVCKSDVLGMGFAAECNGADKTRRVSPGTQCPAVADIDNMTGEGEI